MHLSRLGIAVCAVASVLSAQGLPPEVELLARVKQRMRVEFSRMPDYACLETITRLHKPAGRNARYRPFDTVRMEIGYSGGREWYAWPGEAKFTTDNPSSIASGPGLIANGMFAITLHNLFIGNAATITYRGPDAADPNAIKFDFRFPAGSNFVNVVIFGGAGTVNEEGSFWINSKTLDLTRMEVHATEIPPFLPLQALDYNVDFARTRIGEADTLLARDAGLHMLHQDGYEDYDRISFTHCRMFQAASTLSFDPDPATSQPQPGKPASATVQTTQDPAVPALLKVTIELTSPLSHLDPVGKPIEGKVVGNVLRKGKVLLEDGAPVRGRIRRLELQEGGVRFAAGLEFTEVLAHGTPMRFYADLIDMDEPAGVARVVRNRVVVPGKSVSTVELVLPEVPGVASFFIEGANFTLAPGLRTTWRTRGVLYGVN